MKTRILGAAIALAVLGCASVASAETLARRHAIALKLGIWSPTAGAQIETDPASVVTDVSGSGFLAGISYGYWLEEKLALTVDFTARALDVETRTGIDGFSTTTAAVGSFLLGLKYTVLTSRQDAPVRPQVGGGVGLFRGSQDDVVAGTSVGVTSRSESAFGGHLGIGVDFVLGRHFLADLWTGYSLMTDFSESIGGRKNHSGPEFSVGLGYVF